jgi:hypothetical protein
LLHASLALESMTLNVGRGEAVDSELLPDADGIRGVRNFAVGQLERKVKAHAGVTHGGRLGVCWGRPGLNGSGIGAILTARADENR